LSNKCWSNGFRLWKIY